MFVLSRQAITHRNLILQNREVFLHCLLSRLKPLKLGGSSVVTFLKRIHSKFDVQLNLQEILHKPPRDFIAHSWTGTATSFQLGKDSLQGGLNDAGHEI
jgi:hypothetical protein